MLHPTIYNTAQICHQLGVEHAVLSPGSRNAPLTISFARHDGIKKFILPDERTAGFVALGIAQEVRKPVVLVCTSGTALLNYAPAIAEAFYRELPLIVLSADRPPELIDQRDGQTIRQYKALDNHVKSSYQLPLVSNASQADAYIHKLIEGVRESRLLPWGPVHLNIPFQEHLMKKNKIKVHNGTAKITASNKDQKVVKVIDKEKKELKILVLIYF